MAKEGKSKSSDGKAKPGVGINPNKGKAKPGVGINPN